MLPHSILAAPTFPHSRHPQDCSVGLWSCSRGKGRAGSPQGWDVGSAAAPGWKCSSSRLFQHRLRPPFSSAWLKFPLGTLQDPHPSLETPGAGGRDSAKSRKTSGRAGKFAEHKSRFFHRSPPGKRDRRGAKQSRTGWGDPTFGSSWKYPNGFPRSRAGTAQVQVCPGFPHSMEDIGHPEAPWGDFVLWGH